MRKFILHTLSFVFILVVVNILLYKCITYPSLYKDYEIHSSILKKYNKFIFSDSHGWRVTYENETTTEALNKNGILNFSYGSDSYCDICTKLQSIIDESVNIDTIFLSVDDHMLHKKSTNISKSVYYSNKEQFSDLTGFSSLRYYYYRYLIRYLPMVYKSNQKLLVKYLKSILRSSVIQETQSENTWSSLSEEDKTILAENRALDFRLNEKYNKSSLSCLKKIREVAKKQGITVIAIKFPLSEKMQLAIKGYEDSILDAQTILRVEAFDFTDVLEEDIHFEDEDHVNKTGGQIFVEEFLDTFKFSGK